VTQYRNNPKRIKLIKRLGNKRLLSLLIYFLRLNERGNTITLIMFVLHLINNKGVNNENRKFY
tara:strand:- start:955 stop:1143 length:189 start_codon:yes stop_codon:yes gene_type:complete